MRQVSLAPISKKAVKFSFLFLIQQHFITFPHISCHFGNSMISYLPEQMLSWPLFTLCLASIVVMTF